MLPASESPLLLEQKVCGVKISYLPYLASGHNLNLSSEDMADLRLQGVAVDNDNNPSPKKSPVPGKSPLPQLEEENS